METGTIINSTLFHVREYWVVKCDNPTLPGNRNGCLPIDPLSIRKIHMKSGHKVQFELKEIGEIENYKWYANLK